MSLLELHDARVFADELLERVLRLPVAKAMDLGSPQGFDRASALLAARLRRSAALAEADALREAVAVLDVDWVRTTAAQRRRLVAESLVAAGRSTAVISQRIQAPLGEAATAVINATRTHSRRVQELAIGARFNALDQRVARHIVNAQGLFVRDEYGRRLDTFGREARQVVLWARAWAGPYRHRRRTRSGSSRRAHRAGSVLLGGRRQRLHRPGAFLRAGQQLRGGRNSAIPHRGCGR